MKPDGGPGGGFTAAKPDGLTAVNPPVDTGRGGGKVFRFDCSGGAELFMEAFKATDAFIAGEPDGAAGGAECDCVGYAIGDACCVEGE